jgi:hypothetical protein
MLISETPAEPMCMPIPTQINKPEDGDPSISEPVELAVTG